MTNEHIGTCIYEKGRFELRETDNAIIDLKGDFPPIMIASNTIDDGSEPNCADTRSVLHLLNELADNNPNEERHWYLKKLLDKSWKQYHEQKDENEQLKEERELIKQKLLKYVLDYDKISNDNWNMGLSESVETLQEEVESLFKNPFDWEYEFYCNECNYFKEIKNNFDEANCIKHNKKINYWDKACDKFEWK